MSTTTQRRKPASSVEMLVLRDRLGFGRNRKASVRDPEKRRLLLELASKGSGKPSGSTTR